MLVKVKVKVKVNGKDTETVVNALIENARRLPPELYQSQARDRGKEMAAHKRFTLKGISRSISAIRKIPGSEGRMKTPTACCGSIGCISRITRRANWMRSRSFNFRVF